MPSGAAKATETPLNTSANSNVDFMSLQSANAVFVVVTVPAMECEVEVVGWQKAKRMKSRLVAGQIVGHHVGGAQILQHSVQHCRGAVLLGEAQGEIAPTRSLRNLPQERAARRLVRRCPHINGVDQ